jgi:TonB family protein
MSGFRILTKMALKEVRMSKIRLASALAGGVCVLAAACWIVAGAFPLTAQTAPDGAGVAVELGGSAVMHRTGISYPAAALAKRVEGTVVAQVTLDGAGNVTDAHVVAGPDELRKAVLQSVLQWHFTRESANGARQVSVTFQAPQPPSQPVLSGTFTSAPVGIAVGVQGGIVGGIGPSPPSAIRTMTLKSIEVYGLPDQARAELLASLPVHAGDALTSQTLSSISAAARQFDEHLGMQFTGSTNGELDVAIVAPGAAVPRRPAAGAAAAMSSPSQPPPPLVRQVRPVYPPLAKQARIQGVVVMKAVLAKDGTVQNLTVVSGHSLLVQAALDAAKQWVYQPTLLNGQPVEVSTQISVNFTLEGEPPIQQ